VSGTYPGADVYVVQPTGPLVNDNLVELVLLRDACFRAGAGRVTAVVPSFGYALQDRRSGDRRPIGARVAAEAIASQS
jgi:ribose-phosphate pyrophosphokinase